MRIWDCHCHARGDETGEQVLRAMDAAGIDRINLFSRYPEAGTRQDARAAFHHIAGVQAVDPERIWGLAWANPRVPGIVEEVEHALVDGRLHGIKMIPDHWAPTDEMLFPLYEKARQLGKPIQFHSGILYGFGDSSRFCRPVLYEALVNFPGLRFSLAHISWPWVDECIAVFGRFRAAAGYKSAANQMWIDTCRGTPDAWREEALRKAIPFCGMDRLMFGVDTQPSRLAETAPVHVAKDRDLLRDVIGCTPAQLETFFWGACEALYAA